MHGFISTRVMVASLLIALPMAGLSVASNFPPQIKAGNHRLVLNGWGPRTKFFLELYEAGLYVTKAQSNPTVIADADEPMAIRVKITSSMVSRTKLMQSLNDGFQTVTKGKLEPIQNGVNQFRSFLSEDVKSGDRFDFVYLPRHGLVINKNGQFKGVVPGLAFKQALFNIWLSNEPVDATLKQAMLKGAVQR